MKVSTEIQYSNKNQVSYDHRSYEKASVKKI